VCRVRGSEGSIGDILNRYWQRMACVCLSQDVILHRRPPSTYPKKASLYSVPKRSRRSQAGFTLIEVGIVIALFSVLAAIGWGSTQGQMPRYRLIRAAKDMKGDLVNLRNLAVMSNRETRMVLAGSPGDCDTTDDYGGSWNLQAGNRSRNSTVWEFLPMDTEVEGEDEEQSEGRVDIGDGGNRDLKDVCLGAWADIRGPGTGNGDSIVFSPRGWVRNPTPDFNAQGYVELTLTNQAAGLLGVEDRVHILVSRAGMVRLHSTLGHDLIDNPVGIGDSSKRR
jgi:prepilin-type N-terminal cleavage/methylation domain-containing protein